MNKKILFILFFVLLLVSCKTTVTPLLPEYNPTLPTKPTLEEVTEEVPIGAIRNTIELIGYAESLEIVINNWANYYNSLRNLYTI